MASFPIPIPPNTDICHNVTTLCQCAILPSVPPDIQYPNIKNGIRMSHESWMENWNAVDLFTSHACLLTSCSCSTSILCDIFFFLYVSCSLSVCHVMWLYGGNRTILICWRMILSGSVILKKSCEVVLLMIIFCDEENLFSLKLCQLSLSALSAAAAGQSESLALLQRRPLHPSLKICI